MKKALLLATVATFTASAAFATPITKKELGSLIKEYLVENPEVIVEAMTAYQQKAQEAGLRETRQAVKDNAEDIFNDPNMPFIGDKNAKVAVVEFFDYNCGACKFMFKSIDKLNTEGLDGIKVVFREYPIFGEESDKLAKVGLALYKVAPEKYYDFHAKMMNHKGKADVDQAYTYAEEAGVSRDAIQKELGATNYGDIIEAGKELGNKLKVRGTPFMIIGNEPVPHAVDEAELRKRIAEAKATKK